MPTASLASIRQQYPQYAGMSDAQLAQALHGKFYSQMPFDQFANKVGLKTDPITGAVDTLERSIPFADEASAGVSAALLRATGNAPSLSDAWSKARAAQKTQADAFQAAHPYLSGAATGAGIGGQILAAFGSGGATELPAAEGLLASGVRGVKGLLGIDSAPAAANAGKGIIATVGRTATNAAKGATLNSINAFANTDGDLSTRTNAAGRATLPGAVLGAAAPAVVKGVQTGADLLASRGLTATQKAAMKAAQILRNRAPTAVTNDPAATPDGQFPFQQMGGGGRSLARAVAAVPGPGQDIAEAAIRERAGQAGPRVAQTVQDTLDAGRGDYHQTQQMQTAARAAEADPHYAEAANTPVNELDFQQLMGPLLDTEVGQRALTSARRIAEVHSAVTGEPMTWDQNIIHNGQVVSAQTPSAPMLDMISQGWDEALKPYYTSGRLSAEGRAMLGLRNEYVRRLGQLVPANAEARAAWSQGSDILDSMQTGRDIVRKQTDPELVQQATEGLTPEQQQAQHTGMAYELTGKLRGNNPQAFFRQLSRDQNMQDRLRAGLPSGAEGDAAFARLMESVQGEAEQQAAHNSILTGSRTTPLKEDINAANAAGEEGGPQADLTSGVEAADATRKFLKAPVSNTVALGLKGLSSVRNLPLNDPDVSRHLGEVLFGQKTPEALFGEASTATPSTGFDMNQLLKTLSAVNRGGAAAMNTGQDQPPPDTSWMTP